MNKTNLNIIPKIEQNLLGRFNYVPKNSQSMTVSDTNGLVVINSHLQSDMFNIVCATQPIAKSDIVSVTQQFQDEGIPFAWWFGFHQQNIDLAEMLEQCRFKKTEEELAMVVTEAKLKPAKITTDLTIYDVNSREKLDDFIAIITELLPDECEAINSYYQQAASLVLKYESPFKLMIGTYDGQLAATASLYQSDDIVGIYDVITLPEFRGKGIAQAMTVYAAKKGFELGANYAVLTATDNAKFVYEKIGFQALDMLAVYNYQEE